MLKREANNYISRLRGTEGVTLIEVVLSIVIVALLALMVLTADSAAFTLFRHGSAARVNAESAYTALEQSITAKSGGSTGTVSFKAGAVQYSVAGKYYTKTSTGDQPNVTMTAFVPN